ncbi:hypothetical protein [Microvirga sp. TS319]|uniref:hypothetical protein n=1 Tax=Microvirga sp. TS319 TaxID=3241165 RepID=UPI003519EFDE
MKRILVLSVALAGGVTAAMAQNPDVLNQRAPNMPPLQQMPPEKVEPPKSVTPQDPPSTGSTLSDKLEQSNGVIRPPETGTPDMTVPAPVPNPGTTPVIPPPGSPGGNQQIQPK